MMRACGIRRTRGFTLVETMVVLAVLALSLSVVYETLGWSLRRTATFDRHERAMSIVQSVLAQLCASESLEIGTREGEAEGLRWRYVVQPLERPGREDVAIPVTVVVDVAWGGSTSQQLRLQTVLLARPLP